MEAETIEACEKLKERCARHHSHLHTHISPLRRTLRKRKEFCGTSQKVRESRETLPKWRENRLEACGSGRPRRYLSATSGYLRYLSRKSFAGGQGRYGHPCGHMRFKKCPRPRSGYLRQQSGAPKGSAARYLRKQSRVSLGS